MEQELEGTPIDAAYLNRFLALYHKDSSRHADQIHERFRQYVLTQQPHLLADAYAAELERRRRFDVFYALFCALSALSQRTNTALDAWRVRKMGADYLILGLPDVLSRCVTG